MGGNSFVPKTKKGGAVKGLRNLAVVLTTRAGRGRLPNRELEEYKLARGACRSTGSPQSKRYKGRCLGTRRTSFAVQRIQLCFGSTATSTGGAARWLHHTEPK